MFARSISTVDVFVGKIPESAIIQNHNRSHIVNRGSLLLLLRLICGSSGAGKAVRNFVHPLRSNDQDKRCERRPQAPYLSRRDRRGKIKDEKNKKLSVITTKWLTDRVQLEQEATELPVVHGEAVGFSEDHLGSKVRPGAAHCGGTHRVLAQAQDFAQAHVGQPEMPVRVHEDVLGLLRRVQRNERMA